MKNISKYIFGLFSSIFLLSLLFPLQSASATLELGVGSYFLGGSNKTTGFNHCIVTTHKMDGTLAMEYDWSGGALETISFGRNPELNPGRYNQKISDCGGGTSSIVGVYRNPTESAMGAYGGDYTSFREAYLPGLSKKYFDRSSSIFITADGDSEFQYISLYDVNGNLAYQTLGFAPPDGTFELDLDDITSIPNGRYMAYIRSAFDYHNFNTVVVTRNVAGAPRVMSYRGEFTGVTSLYAPTVRKNYYGFNTVLMISNTEDTAGNVTVRLYPGNYVVYNSSLAGKATVALSTANFNVPNNDYTAVVTSAKKVVAVTQTNDSSNYRSSAYALSTTGSRYQSLPVLWNVLGSPSRVTTVKCMNIFNTTGKIRLTVKGGYSADSPTLGQYEGYEFSLANIPQFPQHQMYAGVAESLSSGSISCIASSAIIGDTGDRYLQYESNFTNNDTNQLYSSKTLTLYDDN